MTLKTQDMYDWKSIVQESSFYWSYPELVHFYFDMYGPKTKIFHFWIFDILNDFVKVEVLYSFIP
jgi:hypothetical protein